MLLYSLGSLDCLMLQDLLLDHVGRHVLGDFPDFVDVSVLAEVLVGCIFVLEVVAVFDYLLDFTDSFVFLFLLFLLFLGDRGRRAGRVEVRLLPQARLAASHHRHFPFDVARTLGVVFRQSQKYLVHVNTICVLSCAGLTAL